jgi:ferredoxin-NADP reductase
MMPKFETSLTSAETVAEGTMAFHFARPAGLKFKAGQSINVSLIGPPETDAKGNARTFSIVSAPHETGLVVATRMRDTAFKRVLKAMPAGGRVGLRGPAGLFTLDSADARPAVFLAGGIGVTPFVSMLREAAHSRPARELWLFYSNRRPEDAAFLDELMALPERNGRIHFVGTMVEMDKSSRPWSGETGFLDRTMLERHLKNLAGKVYYIAGPPGLVEAMQKMLLGPGVTQDAIHTDEFFGY